MKFSEISQATKAKGTYVIHCHVNDFVYFGSTSYGGFQTRFRCHYNKLKAGTHNSYLLQKDFDLYGEDVFTLHILEVCPPDMCLDFEQSWIDIRGVGKRNRSYNICPIAGSTRGVPTSDRTKLKISLATQGRKPSIEQRQRHSAALKGRPVPIHVVQKRMATRMANWLAGKRPNVSPEHRQWCSDHCDKIRHLTQTPESKQKRLESHTSKRIYTLTSPDGEEFRCNNLTEFVKSRQLELDPGSLGKVIRGVSKSHKGWTAKVDGEPASSGWKRSPAVVAAMVEARESQRCYILKSPDGTEYTTNNLVKFIREKAPELDISTLNKVLLGKRTHHKGWTGKRVLLGELPIVNA